MIDNFNHGYKTVGIFIDLARACDTVAHQVLLKKLENIGIRGVALKLFESYLKHRTQQVKINKVLSKKGEVEVGVPQGTVLGPVLFSIYINDLMNVLTENDGCIICYADDSAILIKAKTWQSAYEKAENYITLVKLWLDQNLLTLNETKTNFISFSMTNKDNNYIPNLIIHNAECLSNEVINCGCNGKIKPTNYIKYLGVYSLHRQTL